jgi:PAS domain S-box-containing protein
MSDTGFDGSFVYHLSLVVALGAAILLLPRRRFTPQVQKLLHGLAFGGAALFAMFNPIVVSPGLIFDGRSVLVSLCGLFFGPVPTLIAGAIAAAGRVYQGGPGTPTGLFVILAAGLIGVGVRQRYSQPRAEWSSKHLFYFGLFIHAVMLASMFLMLYQLTLAEVLQVISQITLPVLLLYPLATVILGRILSTQAAQQRLIEESQSSEAYLRNVLEHAPVALALSASGGVITFQNDRHFELFGYDAGEVATVDDWMHRAYPDPEYREEVMRLWEADTEHAARTGGAIPAREYRITSKSGAVRYVEISGIALGKDMLVVFNDVTARRQAALETARLQRLYAMLSQTNKLTTRNTEAETLLEGVCKIAVEHGKFQFAWFGLPQGDGQILPLVRAGADHGYIDSVCVTLPEQENARSGPTGQALQTGKAVVTNHFLDAVATAPWHERARRAGVGASGAFPVFRMGTLYGVFNLYAAEPEFFGPEEIATLNEITAEVSHALDILVREEERARAVAEVHELSQRLNYYFAVSPVISYVLSATGDSAKAIWISDNFEHLLGFTIAEAQEEGWWERQLHPEDREGAIAAVAGVFEHGQLRHEYRFFRKDGSMLWVLDTLIRISDGDDGLVKIFGAWTDITDRKRSEESLRLQSAALNATANAMVITNAEGVIEWVNPAFTKITQYPCEWAIGKNPRDLVKSGLQDQDFYDSMWQAILGGSVWNGTMTNRRKDGSLYIEEQTITPIRDVHGVITHFVAIKKDVTERIQTETALIESQQRLQRALTVGKIALWEWDLRTGAVYYSPEWASHVGGDTFDAAGTLDDWFDRVHSDDLPLLKRALNASCAASAPPLQREFRLRDNTGTYRWVLMKASAVRDDAGALVRVVGTNVDVSERKHLEHEFEQAQKLESIGRLAGGVAHDFNNLLGVILGYTEVVLESQAEGTLLHSDLMEIKRAADRVVNLTRQLLAFSRRQVLTPEVLNLNRIVREAEKMLRRLIGEDIALRLELAEDLGRTMADPGKVVQVLMNLAVNARDAMPRGGTLTITTENAKLNDTIDSQRFMVQPGAYIHLRIADDGTGMDEATQSKVFEPFFTTKEQGKGTGLGLATVYGIVKQSGGYITLHSTPGVGTTLDIYLPRNDTAEAPVGVTGLQEPAQGSETILVAEDEAELRAITRRFLERAGYRVLLACNGNEAIEVLNKTQEPVHLVLTDVIMPGMSGPALAAYVAEHYPAIKIVYMSGYTDDSLARHGVSEVNVTLIMKPFTLSTITSTVRAALDGDKPLR